MSESLYPYYEAELHFVRKLAQEFADKYPAAAARLKLEPNRSADPHVERLIEAAALAASAMNRQPWSFAVVLDRERIAHHHRLHLAGFALQEGAISASTAHEAEPSLLARRLVARDQWSGDEFVIWKPSNAIMRQANWERSRHVVPPHEIAALRAAVLVPILRCL